MNYSFKNLKKDKTITIITAIFLVACITVIGIIFLNRSFRPIRTKILSTGHQIGIVSKDCSSGDIVGDIVLPVYTCQYIINIFGQNIRFNE